MVFLPKGAVLIQVVPFGGLEWLTRVTFKDPAKDMEFTYMDYNVESGVELDAAADVRTFCTCPEEIHDHLPTCHWKRMERRKCHCSCR